jgi:hypothetical protein
MHEYLIELFLIPLGMFLLLFWWRDNLNILHMPLADLIGVLVSADIGIALHLDELRRSAGFVELLNTYGLELHASAEAWWGLAAIGLTVCAVLVYVIERRIRRVAIHHISVISHNPSSSYLTAIASFQSRQYRVFCVRWAASFGITTAVVVGHGMAVNAMPLGFLRSAVPVDGISWAMQLVLVSVATFAIFLLVAALLTALRVFRYSERPLPWTYLAEDSQQSVPSCTCPVHQRSKVQRG